MCSFYPVVSPVDCRGCVVGHDFNSDVPEWQVYLPEESVDSIEWLSGLGLFC